MFRPTDTRTEMRKLVRVGTPSHQTIDASHSMHGRLGAGKVTSTRAAVFRAVYPLLGSMVGVPVWSNLLELIQSQVLEPRPA